MKQSVLYFQFKNDYSKKSISPMGHIKEKLFSEFKSGMISHFRKTPSKSPLKRHIYPPITKPNHSEWYLSIYPNTTYPKPQTTKDIVHG
jgi:hypothetical protein